MYTLRRTPLIRRRSWGLWAYTYGALLVAGLVALSSSSPAQADNSAALVKDINPTTMPFGLNGPVPSRLVSAGNRIFFIGADPNNGYELWASDGTVAGTRLVRDIAPGLPNAFFGEMAGVNGKLFFAASDYNTDVELWSSDGTAAGTAPVKAHSDGGPLQPTALTNVAGTVYFVARDSEWHLRLWKSDGTAAGTFAVKEIEASHLTGVGNRVFFVASDGVHGSELWVSDGTAAGTRMVKDINPSGDAFSSSDPDLTAVGDTLFFIANDGTNGEELWKSDGMDAGTVLLKDFTVAPRGMNYYSNTSQMTDVDGKLFFLADDGIHDREVWVSDGTATGTWLVKDIDMTPLSSPWGLTNHDRKVFFIAWDTSSIGLWKSDGTEAGTTVVKSFASSSNIWPYGLATADGTLYFHSENASDYTLWKSDGSTAGTVAVATLPQASPPPSRFVNVNGRLFFITSDSAHGRELWTSDGTAAGTRIVKDIDPGTYSSAPFGLTNVDGKLFFMIVAASGDYELWTSDGSSTGTLRVKSLGYGSTHPYDSPEPANFTAAGSRLFFTAYDLDAGQELWTSDGTESGTRRVKDINTSYNSDPPFETKNASSQPDSLANVNGILLFSADDGLHGRELWRSDGTESGTTLIKDINPGPYSSAANAIKQVDPDGWALLAASSGIGGIELWRTKGTPESTVQVQDLAPGGESSNPEFFTVAGTRVFFIADDSKTGAELWALDRAALNSPTQIKVYLPITRR